MTRRPQCQTCHDPLRWMIEYAAWGCDRCRMMQPASSVRPAQLDRPTKSNARLFAGLGLGALVIAGGILAAVLAGGGGPSGGLASREEVVKQAFAALTAGDAEALAKLMMTVESRLSLIECEGEMPPVSQKKLDGERATLEAVVAAGKGTKIEIVEIGKDDAPKVEKKGQSVAKGCTSKFDIAQHRFEVTAKVSGDDGKTVEQRIPVELWEVDGKWYLPQPPRSPTASASQLDGDHDELASRKFDAGKLASRKFDAGKLAGSCESLGPSFESAIREFISQAPKEVSPSVVERAVGEVRAFAIERCREDSWPDDVIECFAKTHGKEALNRCRRMLTATAQRKLEDGAKEILIKAIGR